MALYKDGDIIRTYEEQVDHLTKAHRQQLDINNNVSEQIAGIAQASSVGGRNIVRFSWQKQGTFYKVANTETAITITLAGQAGDYVEITSENPDDIPAYGYFVSEHQISIEWAGDFITNYQELTVKNVTRGQEYVEAIQLETFTGTSLLDYNANNNKNQVFRVINDLAYGTSTEYASFDLNKDGLFNFVYVGAVKNGKDGKSAFTSSVENAQSLANSLEVGDSIIFADSGTFAGQQVYIGDVYEKTGTSSYRKNGNIRGPQGQKGERGEQGKQGLQGVQGIQGATGATGATGPQGPAGQSLRIHTGVLASASELPAFSSTTVGEAYRVQNTSGGYVTTDLYFHAEGGTTWDVQSNWGGIKGEKGATGATGATGPQGPVGPQGPKGNDGVDGKNAEVITLTSLNLNDYDEETKTKLLTQENCIVKYDKLIYYRTSIDDYTTSFGSFGQDEQGKALLFGLVIRGERIRRGTFVIPQPLTTTLNAYYACSFSLTSSGNTLNGHCMWCAINESRGVGESFNLSSVKATYVMPTLLMFDDGTTGILKRTDTGAIQLQQNGQNYPISAVSLTVIAQVCGYQLN